MKRISIVGIVVLVAVSGCTTPGETTGVSAATGGVIGAGLGAIIGSQTGDAGTGLAIGAVAGASTGALIGNAIEAQEATLRTQDEAIERQERTIAAQRTEIEQLRRLERDGEPGARGRLNSGAVSGRGVGGRTPVGYAVMPRSGIRESTVAPQPAKNSPPRAKTVPAQPAKRIEPTDMDVASTSVLKSALKSAPKSAPNPASVVAPVAQLPVEQELQERNVAPMRESTLGVEPTDMTIGAVDEVAPPSVSAPAVVGALQGATLEGTGGAQCADAAEEMTRAGVATDSADKLFHLRRALRLCPDNPHYHNRIGEIYVELGRTTDAEYEFREALRLDSTLTVATNNLKKLGKN